MGELPIFSSRAHVFTIDPKTKKTWLPLSLGAVDINYFFDSANNGYRIVSIEDTADSKKVIINCTLTEKMTFKKSSQKFGQWTDTRQGTIFGLGFSSEADLNSYGDIFQECVECTKKKSPTIFQGDNHKNKDWHKESNQVFNNLNNATILNRSRLNCTPTSPIINNNYSKVAMLETELERMTNMCRDLKEQHQSEIQRLKEEFDYANNGDLSKSVHNYKDIEELHQKVTELEHENVELKKRISELSQSNTNSLPSSNQLISLMSLHRQMESIISQLSSCHSCIGQNINDIASSKTLTD